MNESVEKLYSIGKKNNRLIIGLMSGTSLDGLDIALCKITGNGKDTTISLLNFTTIAYDAGFKNEVRAVFSKEIVQLEKICLLNEWIGTKHATLINQCLKDWNISNGEIDLIASHGQTIYHAPQYLHKHSQFKNSTLQIGDADHISVDTGIITISDFRQKHIAAGGEGAPLAAYGDYILFSEKDKDVILLNIGGIANFTYLPAGASFEKIICSDIGPGNTMMDAYVQKHFPGKHFDENGTIAKQGKANESLLNALKENDFFNKPFPKTTGPELFNLSYLQSAMQKTNTINLPVEDVMATLNEFTAVMIADALNALNKKSECDIFISGGGMHNSLLVDSIKKNISPTSIKSTNDKNINPDAKEAILFALLANECVAGNGSDFGSGAVNLPAITMGKISFPK